jgi:hypothetical protein
MIAEGDLTCDRCGQTIQGYGDEYMTAGYYDCSGSPWADLANPGELHVCDCCMWTDSRYIEVYGDQAAATCADTKPILAE